MKFFRHKKTGKIYVKEADAIDSTNARSGLACVVYRSESGGQFFVREAKEFADKFEPISHER